MPLPMPLVKSGDAYSCGSHPSAPRSAENAGLSASTRAGVSAIAAVNRLVSSMSVRISGVSTRKPHPSRPCLGPMSHMTAILNYRQLPVLMVATTRRRVRRYDRVEDIVCAIAICFATRRPAELGLLGGHAVDRRRVDRSDVSPQRFRQPAFAMHPSSDDNGRLARFMSGWTTLAVDAP